MPALLRNERLNDKQWELLLAIPADTRLEVHRRIDSLGWKCLLCDNDDNSNQRYYVCLLAPIGSYHRHMCAGCFENVVVKNTLNT